VADWRLIRSDSVFQWSAEMPNGWAASVSDWSQCVAPRKAQPTYHVAAICRNRIISTPDILGEDFSGAKRRAELLATEQPLLLCTHRWDPRAQECMLCAVERRLEATDASSK
jgi:hypothetical protein